MNQFTFDAMPSTSIEQPRFAATEEPILLQYWWKLLRWRWIIGGTVATAILMGLVITLLTTPQYTAETRVEIAREEQNITSVEGIDTTQATQDDEFYETQYSNLAARSLATRVAKGLRLSDNASFFSSHGVEIESLSEGEGLALEGRRDESRRREALAVDLLLEHVDIAPIPRSRLVDIRYTSASPHFSALIANRWAKEFIAANTDRRFDSTSDAREFLEGRLQDLASRLEESERRAVQYAAANDIVPLGNSVTPDGRTLVDRTLVSTDLEALNAALAQATADRIAAESRARSNSAGLTSPTLATLRQSLAEAQSEYAKLMTRFQPGYPQAGALANQIAEYEGQIDKERARLAAGRRADFQEAAAREANLGERVRRLKSQLSSQQNAAIQYNIFRREAETNRQLYDSLLQRYKEIGVAGIAVSNITIIDQAGVPEKPSSPNLLINIAISIIAGLGAAFLVVVALEQIDEGLRDPTLVPRLLGVPLLGSVPSIDREDIPSQVEDRKSVLSEAYMAIRANLAFSTDHGFPKTLMTTSTRASEGKTTSSVAMAITTARTGAKVLLIDGDLRSPSCHKLLGTDVGDGLSNYLAGKDDWRDLIRNVDQYGLAFMSTGPQPPSAAELFSGDRFSKLLHEASEHFDHIIIDASPLLGLADAPLIARIVEGCVFVIESNGVTKRALKVSIDRLQQAHARVLGAVVTKLETTGSTYGYGYGYGYQYGYGTSADAA